MDLFLLVSLSPRRRGVAPHVTELAAGLERRGHEVHVYSRTGDGQMPYEIIDGVHIHRVPIALDPGVYTVCVCVCVCVCCVCERARD